MTMEDPPRAFFWAMLVFIVAWAALMFIQGCGWMDDQELAKVHVITCPSVLEVYAEAIDAGLEISPEDEALVESCK